jgi:hypothetical protein
MRDNHSYNVCWRMLSQNTADADIKALALFYKLKDIYVNSRVYDYTPAKLQNKIGISAYLISKYVNILKGKGLAVIEDHYDKRNRRPIKVILLKSLSKIYLDSQADVRAIGYKKTPKLRKHKIEVQEHDTLKEISFRLKAVLIEIYYSQQQYIRRCKVDRKVLEENEKAFIPLRRLKQIKLVLKRSDEELSREILLSSRKAYSLFNINPCDFKTFRDFTYQHSRWYWRPRRKIKEKADFLAHEYWAVESTSKKYGYRYWKDGESVLVLPTALYIPALERNYQHTEVKERRKDFKKFV